MGPTRVKVNCTYFDPEFHVKLFAGSMVIATSEVTKIFTQDGEGIWQGAQQSYMTTFVIGSLEQIVRIEGSVEGDSLNDFAAFLQFKKKATPQMIFCAEDSMWVKCNVQNADFFHQKYGADFPEWTPSMNASMPGCAKASTGISCPVHVLLQAAGVNLDQERDGDGKLISSPRSVGRSINIKLDITNVDPWDFWSGGPLGMGPKKKVTLHVSENKVGLDPLFQKYMHDPIKGSIAGKQKVEMYGIHFVLTSSVNLKKFSKTYFVTVLVLFGVMMRYADLIVTKCLVYVYPFLGKEHVSMLYEYNATATSVDETRMLECTSYECIQKAHDENERNRFQNRMSPNLSTT